MIFLWHAASSTWAFEKVLLPLHFVFLITAYRRNLQLLFKRLTRIMIKQLSILSVLMFVTFVALAQPDRWQQRIKYTMNVDMNVQTNQYTGKQTLEYWNNSPDTLKKVFYHLYWNAFQPNSMMDVRSRRQGTIILGKGRNGQDIADWDSRVQDRILNLKEDEIGYEKVSLLTMNGRPQKFSVHETILEVELDKPILPKSKVTFAMQWTAQVPIQIRRSGRDNPATKVRYSMSQWYPKMAEYDYEGWHPTDYIAREFYGVWGDYDVTISIDKSYMLGGTGYLQNPNQIGFGYETNGAKVAQPSGSKLTWHFTAPNVHDFMWAADPEYKHLTRNVRNGLTLHVLYKPTNATDSAWAKMLDDAEKVMPYLEKTFGPYPYKQYSFIHGGDGGMEYPMATLLFDPGAWLHEWLHSWYQGMLATNESLYPWMDEGFTDYATSRSRGFLQKDSSFAATFKRSYDGYFALAKSGREEPMTTHADHYNTNYAYSIASYSKGAVFMEQLGYIVGAPMRDRILLEYYRQWRFKHPNPNDFIRVAEKVSDLKLDWYKMYWVNTTKTIDYGIDSLWEAGGATKVRLSRIGQMPMPVDVKITFKDGTSEWHYVPLNLMFGSKAAEAGQSPRKEYPEWKWTHPTYEIQTAKRLTDIVTVEIDPSQRMADTERKNNKLELKW